MFDVYNTAYLLAIVLASQVVDLLVIWLCEYRQLAAVNAFFHFAMVGKREFVVKLDDLIAGKFFTVALILMLFLPIREVQNSEWWILFAITFISWASSLVNVYAALKLETE